MYELREGLPLCNELVQGLEVLFIVSILLMAGTAEMLEGERCGGVINDMYDITLLLYMVRIYRL